MGEEGVGLSWGRRRAAAGAGRCRRRNRAQRAPSLPRLCAPPQRTGHDGGDEVVEVTEGGGGELQGAEADVVQSLVICERRGREGGKGVSAADGQSTERASAGQHPPPALPSTHLPPLTKDHALVGVLHQLVDGQGGVVGLHHGVGHLGQEGGEEGKWEGWGMSQKSAQSAGCRPALG